MGERVEDVFFITDRDGQRITDNDILQDLEQQLCAALDSHVKQTQ
jgi:UTP:GlnB (protein PII) uridylyltransferase